METPIRILVADDDADFARGTCRLLEQAGYATTMAFTGGEALQSVQSLHPNLVLIDRHLPDADGANVCREIKKDPALADVFVVIISGSLTGTEDQITGLESGADGYIIRPIGNRELTARVDSFVRILRLSQSLREKADALRVLNEALEKEMARRQQVETERERLIGELQQALTEVKTLSGLLPICSGCKKIRDPQGHWHRLETYIMGRTAATFSHGMCPDCGKIYFPDAADD